MSSRKHFFLFILLLFLFPLNIFPVDYYWDGSEGTSWANPDNWDVGVVPGFNIGDRVFIPAGGGIPDEPTLDIGGVNIVYLEVESDRTLTLGDLDIDIDGNIVINGTGILTCSGIGKIYVQGNWTRIGTFNANNSTVIFDGPGCNINNTTTFNNLQSTNLANVSMGADVTVSGTFTMAGVFNTGAFTLTHTANPPSLGNGTLNISGGTFNCTGQNVTVPAGATIDLTGSGGTLTASGLNITGGTVDVDTGTVNCAGLSATSGSLLGGASGSINASGNVAISAGVFTAGNSTLTMSGGAGTTINSASQLWDLIITGDVQATGSLSVGNDLTGAGTLDGGAVTVTIGRHADITNYSATTGLTSISGNFLVPNFIHNNGEIRFVGANNQNFNPFGQDFFQLTVTKPPPGSMVTQIASALGNVNTFTINTNEGAYYMNGFDAGTIGSFSNTGTLILHGNENSPSWTNDLDSGIVEYVGGGTYTGFLFDTFFNIEFNNAGGSWEQNAMLTINGSWRNYFPGTFDGTQAGALPRQITRFTGAYGPVFIRDETGFGSLSIRSANTVNIIDSCTAEFIAIYQGTVNLSTASTVLSSTTDFIAVGASPIDSSTADNWPKPVFSEDPGGSYTAAFTVSAASCQLQVNGNFYVNSCDMTGTSAWNLNLLQDNSDQTLIKTRAYGSMTVSNSTASQWVTATEVDGGSEPADGGGNTRWEFDTPAVGELNEVQFYTVSDYVVRVYCAAGFENTKQEISAALANIRYNNNTTLFIGTFIDAACSTSTDTSGDMNEFYLEAADKWNTDAIGSNAGSTTSTDSGGIPRTTLPNITMAKGTLRNMRFSQVDAVTNYDTRDNCPPVLNSASLSVETQAPNTFNILVLEFSEPIKSGGITTSNQNSDNATSLNEVADNDKGGALVTAGTVAGWGTSAGGDIVASSGSTNGNVDSNTIRCNSDHTAFTIRLGGNVADGGCIRGTAPMSGAFTPDAQLVDNSGNNIPIDTTVTPTVQTTLSWNLTAPTITDMTTDERTGKIDGWIDRIYLNFSTHVQVFGTGTSLASNRIYGSVTVGGDYSLDNSGGDGAAAQGSIKINYPILLQANGGAYGNGDTGEVPLFNYSQSDFKFISNLGRVEMADGPSAVTAVDLCSPVITGVTFTLNDPTAVPVDFDPSPYFSETGTTLGENNVPDVPAAGSFTFSMPYTSILPDINHDSAQLPTDYTYHNIIIVTFSEDIDLTATGNNIFLTPIIQDPANFDFNAAYQRSSNTFGGTAISGANEVVRGLGTILGCNFEVGTASVNEENYNFVHFINERTCYIHIAGWYEAGNFPASIINAATIPTAGASFQTQANAGIVDKSAAANSLVAKDNTDANVAVTHTRPWDFVKPVFRDHSIVDGPPNPEVRLGVTGGSPFITSIDFVLSEAIREVPAANATDVGEDFTLRFYGTTSYANTGRIYKTDIKKLGVYVNTPGYGSTTDTDANDQAFSIEFNNNTFDSNSRISWTYTPGPVYITDLRGNRLDAVAVEVDSLETNPPYIVTSRAAPKANLIYILFDEAVFRYNAGYNEILASAFTYINNYAAGDISITGISKLSQNEYLLITNKDLTESHIIQDRLQYNGSTDVSDLLLNQMDSTILYNVSDIGINFFFDLELEDFVHRGEDWRVTVFDGTAKITPESMSLKAGVNITDYALYTPILYFDVLESETAFWDPDDTGEARSVLGRSLGGYRWQFNIPGNDSEMRAGNELSMVLKIGGKYCYRSIRSVDDSQFNPRDVEVYRVQLENITEQNANVTILNNVINPNDGEVTKLMYRLEDSGPVSIVVYDLAGNVVDVLVNGAMPAGLHYETWNGTNQNGKTVTRGVYFIRVRAPGIFNQIRKVLIIK